MQKIQVSRALTEQQADELQWREDSEESEFKPLTREEAQQWRADQSEISIWRLVGVQGVVGLVASILLGLFAQNLPLALSVLYGSAAVVVPSAVMAYGVTSSALSRLLSGFAQAAFTGFLLWEGVKILLAVVMMWLAPSVVVDLSWLGLLAGLVLTLKVYWFGFLVRARRSNVNG